jgi:hypothetical protein
MIHPITFSIPEEKIVSSIPGKTKLLSDLIPGKIETYIYNTEQDYYNEYKQSFFATTMKKAGWDCMRHYEILANGCVPYFLNIEDCPENTMKLFPKDLLIKGNKLYNRLAEIGINRLSTTDLDEYYSLLRKWLEHTRNHLTTVKMASYVLEKSQHTGAKKILYLSGDLNPDYLRCLTLHGFKNLLGRDCHDAPRVPHIYKDSTRDFQGHYGRGYTYSKVLDTELHDSELDKTIEEDIKRKYYDIVIYGSYHRGVPLYELVRTVYAPNEVIFFCGEDLHDCNYELLVRGGHTVFVREM